MREYNATFDVEGTRSYVKSKLTAFATTASYQSMTPEQKEQFLGALAEMCVSYKSERNPGSKGNDNKRSNVFSQDTHGVRTKMAAVIDHICDGSFEIRFGLPTYEDAMKPGADGQIPKPICDMGDQRELYDNLETSGLAAVAFPNQSKNGKGIIFIGSLMPFNGLAHTDEVALLLHEGGHILDFNSRDHKTCADAIISEYECYKLQYIYEFGDLKGGMAATFLGANMVELFTTNPKSAYGREYSDNLNSAQKAAFNAAMVDISGPKDPQGNFVGRGYLMPTEEFSRILHENE